MEIKSLPGLTHYEEARALQLSLLEQRVRDEIPDTILFLEHHPVVTQGRGLQFTGTPRPRHMPLPQSFPPGISFAESERGGDLTYHGPGQLVVYPIVKLDGTGFGPNRDVAGFLRKLEQILVDELQSWGERFNQALHPSVRESATGVWIGDKKIASIGVAVRKWVTYHGLALNCVNDLRPFHLISPCGFSPEVMTRLKDWVPLDEQWRQNLESSLARRFLGQKTLSEKV